MEEAHQGLTGGHVGADATARNQCLAGLWWPIGGCHIIRAFLWCMSTNWQTKDIEPWKELRLSWEILLCRWSHLESLNVGHSLVLLHYTPFAWKPIVVATESMSLVRGIYLSVLRRNWSTKPLDCVTPLIRPPSYSLLLLMVISDSGPGWYLKTIDSTSDSSDIHIDPV